MVSLLKDLLAYGNPAQHSPEAIPGRTRAAQGLYPFSIPSTSVQICMVLRGIQELAGGAMVLTSACVRTVDSTTHSGRGKRSKDATKSLELPNLTYNNAILDAHSHELPVSGKV
ncbi:hypothetical protein H113_05117 [Trichophyton rubrum MR1459]|uniref:Uncharacterized protein n=1 Tax=Trichophyton soudanense CBS 452.61 TaxID=1215331 RepID=A0A022XQ02_TRISD|nr:hypothetical protein H100_05090 [Trichophyton rubrum MR850]EZF72815.1 hypothetical protein H105_05097 [Trichophyton soudanense CBS 452.61]EZF94179.1 hypothetical protein H113_05117 [Trichophyton rubrum MR1459]